jgi:transcriptional regulator with XRE-family HTH domain
MQWELAHRCGLARVTIGAYVRGAAEPSATALRRLARVLGPGLVGDG